MPKALNTLPGYPKPFGVSFVGSQVNFSIFSENATAVTLRLFKPGKPTPLKSIQLCSEVNKTGNVWHVLVSGIPKGTLYGYSIDGPEATPGKEHRFAPETLLVDPYAKIVSGFEVWGKRDPKTALLGVIDETSFDWESDRPLKTPLHESIIYELHVRGFTKSKTSQVSFPGTYQGLTEKIPYLTDLGVTAVELLPVHEFDECLNNFSDPDSGKPLVNFWGYNSINFFSPKAGYASTNNAGQQVTEFKSMVKAFHKAGIEVILDVVFNHTGEGDSSGPTLFFRGIDNCVYYILDDQNDYANFSGCGNSVNCNHPVVREFIINCLRYWVMEMHIDGFRFDLAAMFSRDQSGNVIENAPLIEEIASDPILADTKIIAEAWDATGLYQVGSFSESPRWAEWNGRFRDDIRSFMCGHDNTVTALATRIAGSSDLFQAHGRRPSCSINFITSHDGFTLYDLVSFNSKRNTANGENNLDGENHNICWNSGAEGETESEEILQLRSRRMKTMAVILLLSQGTPMLLAGDEFCRTQQGNNNAYCQDNPTSWVDWSLYKKHRGMHRFFKLLIQLRKAHAVFRRTDFFPVQHKDEQTEIMWQGSKMQVEDWSEKNKLLCFFLTDSHQDDSNNFFVALNSGASPQTVELPPTGSKNTWRCLIDTSEISPKDIYTLADALPLNSETVAVQNMAAMVLVS